MADNSKIEWCDATWNPVVGCTPISEGCDHCYAARMATRLAGNAKTPLYHGVAKGGKWTGVVRFGDYGLNWDHPEGNWDYPINWREPRRIFVCSMGDLFHDGVPTLVRDRIFNIASNLKRHTFLILTKRPAAMRDHVNDLGRRWMGNVFPHFGDWPPWPLENVWLGTTIENQARHDERVDILRDTPAAKRFVSVEPMLGPIKLSLDGIDQVICGGETGPGARPMQPDWARSLRDQCQASGVPFFFKQLSGQDRSGLLDGREWKEVPK